MNSSLVWFSSYFFWHICFSSIFLSFPFLPCTPYVPVWWYVHRYTTNPFLSDTLRFGPKVYVVVFQVIGGFAIPTFFVFLYYWLQLSIKLLISSSDLVSIPSWLHSCTIPSINMLISCVLYSLEPLYIL